MRRRIGDYGLIGDCRSAALVHIDGSIDWLCAPRFDSQAFFARLLGDPGNGAFTLCPSEPVKATRRRYLGDTLVLETRMRTARGEVALIDFMPIHNDRTDLVRIVRCLDGEVPMRALISPRFDYGRLKPWLRRHKHGGIAVAGSSAIIVSTDGDAVVDEEFCFTLKAGQSRWFTLTFFPSHREPPPAINANAELERTTDFWRDWVRHCRYEGRHREAVVRSLITLKALTHAPTGGIIAAPTASLPEFPGSTRNWDYRFCWLRDATFMLLALIGCGYTAEANAWREWLLRAAAGDASQLQPLYDVRGEPRLFEWTPSWLSGFADSRPVRIGNAAHAQFQLDVFGEVLDTLHQAREQGMDPTADAWRIQVDIANTIAKRWREPDAGIWETRCEPRHFTHSKVMAWVGLDRVHRAACHYDIGADREKWRELAESVREEVMQRGYNSKRRTFTRELDSKDVDASLLLLPEVGFVEPDDERMVGTVAAIERELMHKGYVRRYDPDISHDGVGGDEGAFLPCTCWLADVYSLQGRRDEAEEAFERVLRARNDLGLLSEELDPDSGELLGNFPQALSHVGLIDTALNLTRRTGPAWARRKRDEAQNDRS